MKNMFGMINYIASVTDKKMILEKILKTSQYILDCEDITLFEPIQNDPNKTLKISQLTCENIAGKTYSAEKEIAGFVFCTGELLNVKEPFKTSRYPFTNELKKNPNIRSILCAPIFQYGKKVVAIIQAVNKRAKNAFSKYDEYLIQYLSESSGINLTQAALFNQISM
mmetsp:Transcript_6723/g.13446  ORF Transcript_6723/g.13446 Transcript_6723/m.13446 type:complete len:167 (+) Transcript_6723:997-1497(+)